MQDLIASEFWFPFAVMIVGAAVTYAWRGLGVALSGRLDTNSPLFTWVSCVAYALLAALIARMIVMPFGLVAETATLDRVVAALAALVVFFATRQNILFGAAAGAGSLVLFAWLRGLAL